jgi:hypothetical protein
VIRAEWGDDTKEIGVIGEYKRGPWVTEDVVEKARGKAVQIRK